MEIAEKSDPPESMANQDLQAMMVNTEKKVDEDLMASMENLDLWDQLAHKVNQEPMELTAKMAYRDQEAKLLMVEMAFEDQLVIQVLLDRMVNQGKMVVLVKMAFQVLQVPEVKVV